MKTTEIVARLSIFRGASLNPHDRFESRICAMLFKNEPEMLYKALMQGPSSLVLTTFHNHPDAGECFLDVAVSGNPDRVRMAIDYDGNRDYTDQYQLGELIDAGKLASCPCGATV